MKKVGIIKRIFALLLIFLLSINSFAAIVSDNDGSAFITKAEFDSLKNNFQSQIDSYNQSIDSKIDGAIASYLAGIRLSTTQDLDASWDKYLSVKRTTTSGQADFLWDFATKPYQPYQDLPLSMNGIISFSNAQVWSGGSLSNYGEPFMAGFVATPKFKPTLQIDSAGIVTEINAYAMVMENYSIKWLGNYLIDANWDASGSYNPMILHAGFENHGDSSWMAGVSNAVSWDLSKLKIVESQRDASNGEWQYCSFSEQTEELPGSTTLSMNPLSNQLEWTNRIGDMVCSWTNIRSQRLKDFVETIDFADIGLNATYNTSVLKHSILNQYGWYNCGTSDGASAYSKGSTNTKDGHGHWYNGSVKHDFKYNSSGSSVRGDKLIYPITIAAGMYFGDGTSWDDFPHKAELKVDSNAQNWGIADKPAESTSSAALILKCFWNCNLDILKTNTNVKLSGKYVVKDYGLTASDLDTLHWRNRFFAPNPDSWMIKDNAISYKQKLIKYQATGLAHNDYILPAGGMPIAYVTKDGNLEFTLKNNGTKDIYIFAYADNTQDTLWGKTRSVTSLGVRNDTWDTNEETQLNTWLGTSGRDTALKIASGATKKFTLNDVKNGDYLWVGVLCKDKVKCPVDIESVSLLLEN